MFSKKTIRYSTLISKKTIVYWILITIASFIIAGSITISYGCYPDSQIGCDIGVYRLKEGYLSEITSYQCNPYKCFYIQYIFSYDDFTKICILIDSSKRFNTDTDAK